MSACERCVEQDYTGDLNSVDSAKVVGDSWSFELEYLGDSDSPGVYYSVVVFCTVSGNDSSPKVTSYSSDIRSYYHENEDGYIDDYDYDYPY